MNHSKTIAQAAWNARTVDDVTGLVDAIEKHLGKLKWVPVGGIVANGAPITAASDSGLALNERPTNGIDAVIELLVRRAYGTDVDKANAELSTPRAAAQKLAGVDPNGFGAMADAEKQNLAENIIILLKDGDDDAPTVVITDKGIGQAPEKLPSTILSLFGGNKQTKHFLMGVYGWGGSNTLGFCEYTVIVTVRESTTLDGDSPDMSITIVKEADWDDETRDRSFVYGVLDTTDMVPTVPSDSLAHEGFEHGTRIVHVDYQQSVRGAFINQYNFFSTALYDPVLPVYLKSERDLDKAGATARVVAGVRSRLASKMDEQSNRKNPPVIAHHNEFSHDLDGARGTVRITVDVLDRKDGAPASEDLAKSYVHGDVGVVMTLNGQRQDVEPRRFIKGCKLAYLYKRIIVHVECDGLGNKARSKLFSSTRERSRAGEGRDEILAAVEEYLKNDAHIQKLEAELREKAQADTTEKASQKDLDKLAKLIGKMGGRTKTVKRPKVEKAPPAPRSTDDSHLPDLPTYIKFMVDKTSKFEVNRGGPKRRLMVEINTKNGYDYDSDLTVSVIGPNGETKAMWPATRNMLKGGQCQWLLFADDTADLGDYKLTATLKVGTAEYSDTLECTVLPAKEAPKPGKKRRRKKRKKMEEVEVPAGPNVAYVKEENLAINDMTIESVGRVIESGDKLDIQLNEDEPELARVLKDPKHSERAMKMRRSRYMVPTALGLYEIHELDKKHGLSEDVKQQMEQILAHSVLFAIDEDGVLSDEID